MLQMIRERSDRPFRECPEASLVALAQQGDREAFGELVRRSDRQMKGLAYSMTSNPTLVDDIVGESFLKALANLDQYVAKARFSSWVGRIVINECLALGRAERRRSGISLDEVEFFEAAIAHRASHENPEERVAQDNCSSCCPGRSTEHLRRCEHLFCSICRDGRSPKRPRS